MLPNAETEGSIADHPCARGLQARRLQLPQQFHFLRPRSQTRTASAFGFRACSAVSRRSRSSLVGRLRSSNYYDDVRASGAVAASREITIGRFNPTVNVNLNVNLHANVDVGLINPSYVFATPVFGGQLTLGVLGFVVPTTPRSTAN
jgi:hypothetical protein